MALAFFGVLDDAGRGESGFPDAGIEVGSPHGATVRAREQQPLRHRRPIGQEPGEGDVHEREAFAVGFEPRGDALRERYVALLPALGQAEYEVPVRHFHLAADVDPAGFVVHRVLGQEEDFALP